MSSLHDESILEIYDLERGTRTIAAEFPHIIEAPNWTPDGKYLIFNSEGKIHRFELATGEISQIPTGAAASCNNDHVISSDGRTLAVSASSEGHGSRIYLLPIEGGEAKLVTEREPSYLHGISPDGETLVYCARRGDSFNVYSISSRGGEERRLTFTEGLDDGPEFDSKGEYIWFCSTRAGLMQLYRMRPDGSEQEQISFDSERNLWFPHISPDGEKLVALAYRRGDLLPHEHLRGKNVELLLMSADGSNARSIAAFYGGQGTINVNSWSPDSRRFAFVSYRQVEN